MRVPFHRVSVTTLERQYVRAVLDSSDLRAGGQFTEKCQAWLASRLRRSTVLLTNSATAAIEMSLILSGVGPGDEVIMPTFTFASCGSAVVLRGATPVLVDVQPDTLNIDANAAAAAITARTKAIIPVHYAGVPYDVVHISRVAREHELVVVEDAAHAITSTYDGIEAGTFGQFGCFSFHHTKNVSCGEGGALIVNDEDFSERAHVVYQNGTDYAAFRRGIAPEYKWMDSGGSFMPSDLTAAFLCGQLERADHITEERLAIWNRYHDAFGSLEQVGVQRPAVPAKARHNGHIYYLLLPKGVERSSFQAAMLRCGLDTRSHYVPLDLTPGGRRFARVAGSLPVAHSAAERIVRLPLWVGMGDLQDHVIEAVTSELGR